MRGIPRSSAFLHERAGKMAVSRNDVGSVVGGEVRGGGANRLSLVSGCAVHEAPDTLATDAGGVPGPLLLSRHGRTTTRVLPVFDCVVCISERGVLPSRHGAAVAFFEVKALFRIPGEDGETIHDPSGLELPDPSGCINQCIRSGGSEALMRVMSDSLDAENSDPL